MSENRFPDVYKRQVNDRTVAFLKTVRMQDTENDMEQIARTIVDTLNAEAMTSVRTAFTGFFDQLSDLPLQYQKCALALRVSGLFSSGRTVVCAEDVYKRQNIDTSFGLSPKMMTSSGL